MINCHSQQATPYAHQRGAALLGLLLLVVLGGSLFFLNIWNSRNSADNDAETVRALNTARERVLAYAASYNDLYGTGHGRLVCQDGNNDGEPAGNTVNAVVCEDRTGRLPVSTQLPDGSVYHFSDGGQETGQQFWYRASPAWISGAGPLNSASGGQLSINGEGGYVAVVLAPQEALSFQNRNLNDADFYPTEHLEADNQSNQGQDYAFVTSAPASPGGFNDLVTGIHASAVMSLVTPRVAETVYSHLESHWDSALANMYPQNQSAFEDCLATVCTDVPVPAWYAADEWPLVSVWQPVDSESGTLQFSGCAITFTLQHNSGVVRNGNRC